MSLEFVGIDPATEKDKCPTVWNDDAVQEFVLQGWKAGAELLAKCLETGNIPDSEAVIRMPYRMCAILGEACTRAAAFGAASATAEATPRVWNDEEAQEFIFQGWTAGEELLAKCRETGSIPDYEAVIRLPYRMMSTIRKACERAERAGVLGTAG